jgi:hypothetical protein
LTIVGTRHGDVVVAVEGFGSMDMDMCNESIHLWFASSSHSVCSLFTFCRPTRSMVLSAEPKLSRHKKLTKSNTHLPYNNAINPQGFLKSIFVF